MNRDRPRRSGEAISTLTRAEIALASPDPGLNLTALLDKPARLTVLDTLVLTDATRLAPDAPGAEALK